MKAFLIIPILSASLMCMMPVRVSAQHRTEVVLTDFPKGELLRTMQHNAETVINIINQAYYETSDSLAFPPTMSFPGTCIADSAAILIKQTRKYQCSRAWIGTKVLRKSISGYQIRNIPIIYAAPDNDGDRTGEIFIDFDENGRITLVAPALSQNVYQGIRSGIRANDVEEETWINIVSDVLEKFQSAYNTKDIAWLDRIYSDDALIITGTTQLKVDENGNKYAVTDYQTKDKQTYIRNLENIFKTQKWIKVELHLDDIRIQRDIEYPYIFGVTLVQDWELSSGYKDKGYLFLLFDFKDIKKPRIWVRVWENMYDETTKEKLYPTTSLEQFSY